VLWESLNEEETVACLKVLQKATDWIVWCRANPSKKEKVEQAFQVHSRWPTVSLQVNLRSLRVTTKVEKQHQGGIYVTRARGRWRRGDESTCAAHANMERWAHHNINLDVDTSI
jgi:cytochrome oxidase Cu insertion factor (SCO1/SenC/PrrC family)